MFRLDEVNVRRRLSGSSVADHSVPKGRERRMRISYTFCAIDSNRTLLPGSQLSEPTGTLDTAHH